MSTTHAGSHHIEIKVDVPDAYRALAAFTRAAPDIDHALAEIVKVRVSQINGCAYCVDLHLGLARKAGVPQRVLDAITVWHESPFFAENERAALSLAEALTLLPAGPVPEEVYEQAAEHFPDPLLAELVVVITAIGAWNRVMLVGNVQPRPLEDRPHMRNEDRPDD
jgi:AhpD family alkylhydroperoxidase